MAKHTRIKDDVYPTPEWCVHRLLDEWCPNLPSILLEPCVGDGAILKAFQTAGMYVHEWHISDKHLTSDKEYEIRGLLGFDDTNTVLPALPIGGTYVGNGCYSQYRV